MHFQVAQEPPQCLFERCRYGLRDVLLQKAAGKEALKDSQEEERRNSLPLSLSGVSSPPGSVAAQWIALNPKP